MKKIINCETPFKFKCPKRWEELEAGIYPDTRFCNACRRNVYFCKTMEEVSQHASNENCIAIEADRKRIRMGVPAVRKPDKPKVSLKNIWSILTLRFPLQRHNGNPKQGQCE
jgi:hypothetical protein